MRGATTNDIQWRHQKILKVECFVERSYRRTEDEKQWSGLAHNNSDCPWGNPGVAYCLKPIAFGDIPLEINVMAGLTICHVSIVSSCKNWKKFYLNLPKC